MLHLLTRWMKTGLVREREGSVVKRWSRPSGAEMAVLASLLLVPPPCLVKLEPCVLQKVHTKLEGAHPVSCVKPTRGACSRSRLSATPPCGWW